MDKRIGLSDVEVKFKRKQFGSNTFDVEPERKLAKIIKGIISEPLFLILVSAVTIYFILGEFQEGIIMLVALSMVSGISIYQENKSRNALSLLDKLTSPRANVIRSGVKLEIPAEEIVTEDLIVVTDGNVVPADAQILEAHDLSVNESILTGEALPVLKEAGDDILQGTVIMSGSCIAIVIAVGKQTSLGKVGQSLKEIAVSKTPLQLQITKFVRYMVVAGTVAFFIVWGVNYYISKSILQGLLSGLTLAMSVLPEEIPVAFSTFMALGAYHLYKSRVIVRTPHTVETLGAATVICTDKTGTITENEMELAAIYDFQQHRVLDFLKESYSYSSVLEYGMWASETDPFDPMEKSIHKVYAITAPFDKRSEFELIHEYPLSGQPPVMTHVFSNKKGIHIIAVKGSVEGVLSQTALIPEQKIAVRDETNKLATKGFRVLAVGHSNRSISNLPSSQQEFEFEFDGLLAFYDPPKKNIREVVQQFYDAGIKVKMITGDYPETAIAIASQINFRNGSVVLTGDEVMLMSELQLDKTVNEVNIYARMFPVAKLKVIEALKRNNEIVAMTGDGVNDGPALKAAHIGIAMGQRGSEMAKQVASLVLTDDDLSHMVEAIALGRRIYENLKKAIRYIISIHIPIILIVTVPLLLLWKFTDLFFPVHVIFLELIMGPTCSIIYENEPIEADSMKKQPRKMSKTFFTFSELSISILQGLIITMACLGLGYAGMINNRSLPEVRTVVYTTLIFCNLFLTLFNRSFYFSIFTTIRYKNRLIPPVLLISLVVLFLSVYVQPVRDIFQFEALSLMQLISCLLVAFTGTAWVELYKLHKRRKTLRKQSE